METGVGGALSSASKGDIFGDTCGGNEIVGAGVRVLAAALATARESIGANNDDAFAEAAFAEAAFDVAKSSLVLETVDIEAVGEEAVGDDEVSGAKRFKSGGAGGGVTRTF